MINSFSAYLSGYIYRNNERGHVSKEVMQFALIGIFTNGITILLSLLIGLTIGKFQEACITVAALAALRLLAGGRHLTSPEVCIIVSAATITAIPFIPVSDILIYIMSIVSAILIWIYAPVDMKEKTRISDRSLLIMKYSGMALVLSNLLILSGILSVSWFIASLTLISFKGGESHD
jgi:Membrane protein putatively involved in post-translational modification of the autoinducing quorum-sensing peptide